MRDGEASERSRSPGRGGFARREMAGSAPIVIPLGMTSQIRGSRPE